MYNRYIPQSDGTYRRNSMQENKKSGPGENRTPVSEKQEPPNFPPHNSHSEANRAKPKSVPATEFLKNIFPKNMDTEDLLVVILLLLMSADCKEDKNTPLLTLALYLFMD